jgi:hypothetical protein
MVFIQQQNSFSFASQAVLQRKINPLTEKHVDQMQPVLPLENFTKKTPYF